MKAKLLFLLLVVAAFVGCSKDDDDSLQSKLFGCWELSEVKENGEWISSKGVRSSGVLVLRLDGQYYNTINAFYDRYPIGTYKSYGDSLVFYNYDAPQKAVFYCKFSAVSSESVTIHYSSMSKKEFYDVRCRRGIDKYDFEYLKEVECNPIVHYPDE